jgi:hypothetical protein
MALYINTIQDEVVATRKAARKAVTLAKKAERGEVTTAQVQTALKDLVRIMEQDSAVKAAN